MKKLTFLSLVMLLLSCELEEINQSPNVPLDVPMSTILPLVQTQFSDVLGGRLFRFTGIFSQQLTGSGNQELLAEGYNPDELFVGYIWEDLYAGPLINLRKIEDKAAESQSPHYGGIAKIMRANILGVIADVWGDAPSSDALQGGEEIFPLYDSQELIYAEILQLLDEGITEVEASESVLSPSVDDVIYQGDMQAWSRAAHALKCRYLLHKQKREPGVIDEILGVLPNGLTSFLEDLEYPYAGSGARNPMYVFFDQTIDARIDPQYISALGVTDPRFNDFIDIIPFTGGQSKVGPALASEFSPIVWISFVEQQFIAAEVHARLGHTVEAKQALDQAVRASIEEHSLDSDEGDIQDYLDDLVLTGDDTLDLDLILKEKFAALLTQLEPWTDYRRTGRPALSPNPNGTNGANPNGEIPRRMIYPQSERLINPNFPQPAPNMQDRFWWDL